MTPLRADSCNFHLKELHLTVLDSTMGSSQKKKRKRMVTQPP